MIKNSNIKKQILKINLLFEQYLTFVESLFCMRCYLARCGHLDHHRGGILYLLNQKPAISKENFLIWLNHADHGFLHGLCVGFWAFLQHDYNHLCDSVFEFGGSHDVSEKNLDVEKLFYSCFFHDYARCVGEEKDHDKNLLNYFQNCINSTYTHSNPSESDSDDILVVSDRIELNRFNDKSWIDQKKLNKNKFILKNNNLIEIFYSSFFPALSHLFFNRHKLWIRHMSESIFFKGVNIKHFKFYPEKHWLAHDKEISEKKFTSQEKKYASIELDYLPFNCCFNHGWSDLCGLMVKDDFCKYGNSINCSPKSTKGRDHAFMVINNKLETDKWIFCFSNEYSLDWIDYTKEKIISVNNIKNFCKIYNLSCSKIEGLKVE